MVVGRNYAWGHIGKTGGDATWKLFQQVPDLVEWADPTQDSKKHQTFVQAGVQDRPMLILNLRRLPSAVLSFVNHVRNYGVAEHPKGTVLSADEASRIDRLERAVAAFTVNGTLPIHRWLRMENLRDDFIDFVETIRPLTSDEIERISTVETKKPMNYNHDVHDFFGADQLRTLYSVNPLWSRFEREVYGNLLVEEPARA